MERIDLGGLTTSAQGLGCMGMSQSYGQGDWDESIRVIHRAIELGVTLLDTADVYGAGHNEVLVGRALVGHRDEVELATKFGIDNDLGPDQRTVHGTAAYVKQACENSLTRLGVDHIDLYYLHRPPQDAEVEETVGAMAELVPRPARSATSGCPRSTTTCCAGPTRCTRSPPSRASTRCGHATPSARCSPPCASSGWDWCRSRRWAAAS